MPLLVCVGENENYTNSQVNLYHIPAPFNDNIRIYRIIELYGETLIDTDGDIRSVYPPTDATCHEEHSTYTVKHIANVQLVLMANMH